VPQTFGVKKMNASTFLSRAIPAALLTILSAGAVSQPLPRTSLNKAGPGHSFIFGTAPAKHPAATDGGCAADGLCLAVTLALADSSNPNLCGTVTDLAVDIGDQINICYTVTNNSSTALNYQSLSDDHVGQLLSNQSAAIAPGASYQYNRTIYASTNPSSDTGTFTSTWTATDVLPGYTADSTAAYNFIDISTIGTELDLDLGSASPVTMPFAFSFYGASSSILCVGNNGEFRFTTDCPYSPNIHYELPASTLNGPAVLPYWGLMLANGPLFYATLGTAPNRQFVVEYKNKFSYGDGGDPTGQTGATFEVILNEADSSIDFEYQTASFGGAASNYDNGAFATVGLQFSPSLANQYSYNTASLNDGLAIRWTPVPLVTYTSTAAATLDVGSPTIITTPNATTGFSPTVSAGGVASAPLLIDNIGNRDLDWSLTPPAADAHFPKTQRATVPFHSLGNDTAISHGSLRKPTKTSTHVPAGANAVPVYASAVKAGGGADFVTFDALNPGTFTTILPDDHALFGETFVNDDFNTLYGVSYLDGNLYAVSTLDGSSTLIGNTGLVSCCFIFPGGMRWDPTTDTTYLVIDDLSSGHLSLLFTIDLTTAATTFVGLVDGFIRDITFDSSGLMYGIDSDADTLVAIDKTSGTSQTIGSIGFDAIYGQGLDFDLQTGVLYLSSTGGDEFTHMYSVDPLTGATTLIGETGGEVDSMAIAVPRVLCSTPTNTPWLSYDVSNGTVTPDPDLTHPATVNVSFDATDLAPGSYTANVCVYSNDSLHSRVAIPVSLTVNPVGPVDEIFADGFDGGGSGGTTAIAQTTDTTPVAQNSAACGDSSAGTTADNQYWRRYYFNEYSLPTPASVASVDVSIEQTNGAPNVTVTLYTIAHSVAVDTIDLTQLTQIGQATAAAPANAALTTLNVPVTGTVTDTTGSDLVVEVSTDDGSGDGTAFYIGSTPSAETHPSFLSSTACGLSDPTPTAGIGFANMHIIQAVNVDN